MKISAKGIHAVGIMLDILEYGETAPVAIRDVAARQDISNKYAEQVVSTLNVAGLVRSIRGPKGGYQASELAREATAGTILRLTESVLKEQNAPLENLCLETVLEELDAAIDAVLDRYTLPKLLEMKREAGMDYVI